ncbi:right-handed parallel beta-helix repeat-containing protein [Dehalococcoidia bacterium]|nr:right-handed parallel beta-helix repeat-containing protein [Dehalococcoidia bacterium]
MKLLEWLCNKANLSILKPRNPTKKVRSLIVVACCIALLAMLGCPVAEPGIQFVPNGDGVFTIGHIAHAPAADFVADGVDDHIQFQQALDALPTGGGKLIVLAGTYNFGAAVGRAIDNVTIQGIGQATVINRDGINPVFTAGAQSNWVFRDFKTDAGGIELTAAKNYTLQNVTIGASYIAFRTDAAAEAWDIPIGRTATIVVAAHNSSPQSKAQADFVADGVDDQVEIQAAIDALPAGGGKVVLMEGTFIITPDKPVRGGIGDPAGIILPSNTTLEGQGISTVLRLVDNFPSWNYIIYMPGARNAHVRSLRIDQNAANQPGPPFQKMRGVALMEGTHYSSVEGIFVDNISYSEPITLIASHNNIIVNNVIEGSLGDCINLHTATSNIIAGNVLTGVVGVAGHVPSEAIDLAINSNNNIIANNIIRDTSSGIGLRGRNHNNTIIGNSIFNVTTHGIFMHSKDLPEGNSFNTIENNTIINPGFNGIAVGSPVCLHPHHHLHIKGNTIIESGDQAIRLLVGGKYMTISNNRIVYPQTHGMYLHRIDHSIISGNLFIGASQRTHNRYIHLWVADGSHNIISNNSLHQGDRPNKPWRGILVDTPTSKNIITGNMLRESAATDPLVERGTNNTVHEARSDLFMDVLAASTTHIHPAITPDGLEHTDVTSPDVPRNTMIRITNTDTVNAQTPDGGNIVIEGVDARGNSVSETLVVPATSIPAGGTSDVFGSKAFATVSKVTYYTETNIAITVSVGISNRIGLPVCSSNLDGVFRIARNRVVEAVGPVDLVNGTVDLGTIAAGDDFLIHYRVNLNVIR